MLFTGAGFSASGRDLAGSTVPTTQEVTQEIWDLCFPDEARDPSSLTDLFHYASHHCPDKLDALLRKRLFVDPRSLDAGYQRWFTVPWKRAWTLNVDDLEQAAQRRFRLPRRIETLSALSERFDPRLLKTDALAFIHLNGFIGEGISRVTFSTTQYGGRLARHDPWYEQFVDDLMKHPFVIVGTRLEEAPFWRHLHAVHGDYVEDNVELAQAVIVSRSLTRARQLLLEDLGIQWLKMSAEDFAREVLDPPLESRKAAEDEVAYSAT